MKKSSLFVLCIVMMLAVALSFVACTPKNTGNGDISSVMGISSDNAVTSANDVTSEVSSEITTSTVVEISSKTPSASSEISQTPSQNLTSSASSNKTSSTTSRIFSGGGPSSTSSKSPVATSSSATSSKDTSSAITSSAITSSASTSSSTSSTPTTSSGKNLVVAGDQYGKRIVVYDLDKVGTDGDLDKAEVWEYVWPEELGKYGIRTASVKYRENTIYGNVIVAATYSEGPIIVKYPSKELVWRGWGANGGKNPHSVEILPSGNMLLASSDEGIVRIFNNANVISKVDKKIEYTDYTLSGAHGLLYDPDNNYVWALGSFELVAYKVIDNGDGTESLEQVQGVGGDLPSPRSGHDLSADLTNSRYIFLTNKSSVVRYDKQLNVFNETFPGSDVLSRPNLKSFSNNTENNFISCYPYISETREWSSTSVAGYCSDTMFYYISKGNGQFETKTFTTKKTALYKIRTLCGQYN